MSGLLDGLTDYLRAVGSGISANNTSALGAGLAGFARASKARGLASGLSGYANAGENDDEARRQALAQMANANPEQTMGFISKNKMADKVNTGSSRLSDLQWAWGIYNDKNATPEEREMAGNILFNKSANPDYLRKVSYARKQGTNQAAIDTGADVINATTPAEVERKSKITRAEKDVALDMNPKIEALTTQARNEANIPYEQKKADIEFNNAQRMIGVKANESYASNMGKQQAEKDAAKATLEKQKPALLESLDRVIGANLGKSGSGIGILEGKAPPLTKQAGINVANLENAYAQMNIYMRSTLKAAGITGKEMDAAVEANAYRYVLRKDMSAEQIKQTIKNFKKDMLSGDLERNLLSSIGGEVKTNPSISKEDAMAELKRRGLI